MDMNVRVTNRLSSDFDITLDICDSPDDIVGRYKCEVGNRLGNDTTETEYYTVEGEFSKFHYKLNQSKK